jgi:hypothetical protein
MSEYRYKHVGLQQVFMFRNALSNNFS